ncbi:MAG: glycosyltransferase family 4 protein [Pseudomarimonas sp.]
MLRPLLLTENFPPGRGGMAQSCDRIVRALRGSGVSVDVAHFSTRASGLQITQQHGGRLYSVQVEEDSGHAINLLWNALGQSARLPTHVIAFGGLLPLLAGPVFAAWWQQPLIVLLRGNDFDTGIVSLRRGWVVREALARADKVGVVTRDHQRKVAALYPATPVQWIPNSIDASEWRLHEFDRQRAQRWRQSNVAHGRRVIGLFGHLKQKKGGTLLLEALRLSGDASRFHLLVVGDIEPAMLEPLAAAAEYAGVNHIPFVDRFELLPWYAACDLIALPSHYDGLPNVMLEAGALAVPLLAASAGGMADILKDGENALTFAPGDLHQCVHALMRASTLSESALRCMGEHLQAQLLASFRPQDELAGYIDLLHDTARAVAVQSVATQPIPLHGTRVAQRSS